MEKSRWRDSTATVELNERDVDYILFHFDNGQVRTNATHHFYNGHLKSPQVTTRRLRKLAGKVHKLLHKQERQRFIDGANSNFLIYEHTPHGEALLLEHGRLKPEDIETMRRIRGRGAKQFWHEVLVGDIKCSKRFALKKTDLRYIPTYEALHKSDKKEGNPLAIEFDGMKLRPDDIDGIEYPDAFVFHILEADMGNEPIERQSYGSSFADKFPKYQRFLQQQIYARTYGFKSQPYVTTVTTNERHMKRMLKVLNEKFKGDWRQYMLFKAVPHFGFFQETPDVPTGLILETPWTRCDGSTFDLLNRKVV